MASIYSAWSAYKKLPSASAKRRIRAFCNYTVTITDGQVTVTVTSAGFQEEGGTFTSSVGTGTLSATGGATYTGTGKLVYQSASYVNLVTNKTYSWNRTTSDQTKTLVFKVKMPSDSIFAGTYSASVNISVPVLPTKTRTYDANGGSGAPESDTAYYGVVTTLPTDAPTRTGYTFQGWATTSTATVASWKSGEYVSVTADTTFYAVWKTKYVAPTISGVRAYRVNTGQSGFNPPTKSDGQKGYFDLTVSGGSNYTVSSVKASINSGSAITMSKNGSTNKWYGYSPNGAILLTEQYAIAFTITVAGTDGVSRTIQTSTYISKEEYLFDIAENGKRFSFGAIATDDADRFGVEFSGDMIIKLTDGVQITDTGTTIAVIQIGGTQTDDYLLAKAIVDTFDYATAKEILEV